MPDRHFHSLRVYVEDTDIGGIVYYANYLKFAERARTEMLREVDLSHATMIDKEHLFLAVRKCEIEYIKPAYLDDWLRIETAIEDVSGVRLKMKQNILKDQELLSALQVEIVCISENGKPVRLPANLLKALRLYQPTKIEKVL